MLPTPVHIIDVDDALWHRDAALDAVLRTRLQDPVRNAHLSLQVAQRRGPLRLSPLRLLRRACGAGVPILLLRRRVCAVPGRGLQTRSRKSWMNLPARKRAAAVMYLGA